MDGRCPGDPRKATLGVRRGPSPTSSPAALTLQESSLTAVMTPDTMPVPFPFGHGLSYTKFAYDGISVSDNGASVSTRITNTGMRAGAEVVQLYVHDMLSTVVRPDRELEGFEKVYLEPGASATEALPSGVRSRTNGWSKRVSSNS